jgi:sulfur-oxidizing protein SoxY
MGQPVSLLRTVVVAASLVLATGAPALAQSAEAKETWRGLARDIFQGRPMTPGDEIVSLRAPKETYEAAIVPMTISLEKPATFVRKVTLVIDQNPAPMAATLTIGPQSGLTMISTRVRVNDYTNVHAVAETADGSLHVVERFVKAAGGCSAPSVKNMDEIAATMGQMKFREILAGDLGSARRREAQIMIRHPNNSGMQMDQSTGKYIPARYVDHIVVKQGDDLVFEMTGGISISEDPNFRFTYVPNGAKTLTVEAHDSEGAVWKTQYPLGDAS